MDVAPETDPLTDLAIQLFYKTPLQIDRYVSGLTYRYMEDRDGQMQPLEFSLKYPQEVYDAMVFDHDVIEVPNKLFEHGIYMKTQQNAFDNLLDKCSDLVETTFKMIAELPKDCLECDEDFDIEKLRAEEQEVCAELEREIRLTEYVLGGVEVAMNTLEQLHFG